MLPFPDHEEDFELVALRHPARYAIEEGRLASTSGLDLAPADYPEHFTEHQVPHSTALHSRLTDGRAYLTGPLARYRLGGDRLSPVAREAAAAAGLEPLCRNPFRSIVVRAVEILYAVDEALRLIETYEPPEPAAVAVPARAGAGHGWTEAPRGTLWHRYVIDEDGIIQSARIVPPTSQNQARIEETVAAVVAEYATLDDAQLQHRCEQAVRSFDPCISCATHFLRLEIERC
jgi:coenzyme F420-reducing hydrogenase alpha subunit